MAVTGGSAVGEQDYQYSAENSPANYQKWRQLQNDAARVHQLSDLIMIADFSDLVIPA
ncbi:hypothetical protein [Psychromonas ossibalaenae]|uniref:hypothetical protein n=1 Tax=Psychromonas ossibalaenae TaxID=444922 RepID=UPI00035E9F6F|nr:hypothetical protein [Psychromonas ossibalaenae]